MSEEDKKPPVGDQSQSNQINLKVKSQVPLIPTGEWLPERPGEPDCQYFLKTQRCKFGVRCKFNHPKIVLVSSDAQESAVLSEKPSERPCAFYMKAGKCKFGASCKFHHLEGIQLPSAAEDSGSDAHAVIAICNEETTGEVKPLKPLFTPALLQTSKGLPVRMVPLECLPERPGERDCHYFLKTQRCKFGVKCKFNHPKIVLVSSDAQSEKPSEPPCAENRDLQPAFEVLPDDLLVLIFSRLGDRGQIRLQAVCQKWKRLIATVEPRGGLLYHLGTGELLDDLASFMLPGETVSRAKRRLERGPRGLIDLKNLKAHMHRVKGRELFEERVKKLLKRGMKGIRDWTREEVLEAAKKF